MKAVKVLQERGRERGNFAPFPFPLSVAVAARVEVAVAVWGE